MESVKIYNSIHDFNREFGCPTLHPLIDVGHAVITDTSFIKGDYAFNFYTIMLNESGEGTFKYGRNNYDFGEGSMIFTAPGQVMREQEGVPEIFYQGWSLMFHKDLLLGTQLGNTIGEYSFFNYDVNEALHLSKAECDIISNCFRNLRAELEHPIDENTKGLLISYLELILRYCRRFYERQFMTRADASNDILSRFEALLDEYFNSGELSNNGIPSVKYCADRLNLSANYLSDLLRKYTGKSALEHIQLKIVETAKSLLLYHSEKTVNEIAYDLGFEYPQYFSRLFKKRVGLSPTEFRTLN